MDRVRITACLALLAAVAETHGTGVPEELPSVRDISLNVDNESDPVLNIVNLERVRRFILDQGLVMMTNRYANVPCYQTAQYAFSLHPDARMRTTGDLRGWPEQSFTTLDIVDRGLPSDKAVSWARDRRSSIEFEHEFIVQVRTSATDPRITVADLYALPVDGIAALMDVIDGRTSARGIRRGGNCSRHPDDSEGG